MSDETNAQHEAEATYLRDAGWHTDPAEPRRWRHSSFPSLDPLTLSQALEIQRNLGEGEARGSRPTRSH